MILPETDNQIIEFTILFNRHKKKIYNYALKMLCDRMMADDVVQNVFLKLFENLNNIYNKQSIQFWLFKTARNEILGLFRNKSEKLLYTNAADVEDVEIKSPISTSEEIEKGEISSLILKELEMMQEEFKEVFVLREYSGLSYREISAVLGIDEDLVKSRLYKARRKLIDKIEKYIN